MDQPYSQPAGALAETDAGRGDGRDDIASPPAAAAGAVDELIIDNLSLNSSASEDRLSVQSRKSSSRLENLPAELRLQILFSMPDFDTLHRLVHASPVMYAQYRAYRTSILTALLDRELACVPRLYASLIEFGTLVDQPMLPLTDEGVAYFHKLYYDHYAHKQNPCPYLTSVERNSLCSLAKQEKTRSRTKNIAIFLDKMIFGVL
jgi:hypothetical protein